MQAARKPRGKSLIVPKPVHPTAIRNHGFLGITYVRQHMMIDEKWSPASLTEQFKGMTDLLAKHVVVKKLEANANRKRFGRDNRNLKLQCRDGRSKLHMCLTGQTRKMIRNYLINHKDMQRLYQKMPIQLVNDNINQRTFVLRKERDRLRYRLDQLKKTYESKLLERAVIENRIKYENEFVLDEEIRSRYFRKKIENSNIRLKAIKSINGTYKKMIQVLHHDGIFYDPILRSLSKDIDDQGNFIKHILYLGMPAIESFKLLSEEYRQMEDKSRKALTARLQLMASWQKEGPKRFSDLHRTQSKVEQVIDPDRYVRETLSMNFLKNELESVENTIKQVKFATLCSQAKEIYPRIKSQVESNEKLKKIVKNYVLGHGALQAKMKRADVLEGVLINNLSEEEDIRYKRINELKDEISKEDKYEADTLAHMKNRGDSYVLLRYTLWNLNEVLRHIDRSAKMAKVVYPNSYLKLPLIKFEMLTMRAVAPDNYEENIDEVMRLIKRKVQKLMKAYIKLTKDHQTEESLAKCTDAYHHDFLECAEIEEYDDAGEAKKDEEDDLLVETKTLQNVPNRKQIKAQSAKLVEELSKKED